MNLRIALFLFACLVLHLIGCALADWWRKPAMLQRRLARAIMKHGARSPEVRAAEAALDEWRRGELE